jgi:peptide/nickel transport system permease protein
MKIEQLALIKMKYGFDKPIATQYLYYLNDLSPLHYIAKRIRLHVFERRKIQCGTIIQFLNLNLVIKTPYLESFQKSGKKYLR